MTASVRSPWETEKRIDYSPPLPPLWCQFARTGEDGGKIVGERDIETGRDVLWHLALHLVGHLLLQGRQGGAPHHGHQLARHGVQHGLKDRLHDILQAWHADVEEGRDLCQRLPLLILIRPLSSGSDCKNDVNKRVGSPWRTKRIERRKGSFKPHQRSREHRNAPRATKHSPKAEYFAEAL